jgi:membrane associated rhomboid family serine protease
MIPIRTDSPLRRTPWMNWGIIAANVLFFLVTHKMQSLGHKLALNPRNPELWQFFTYSLVHANGAHLVGNMLFLFIFGNNLDDKMGHAAYLAFYLAGGVFSGVVYCTGGDVTRVVGASGAVSAVTGAYIVLFPRAQVTIAFFFFIIAFFEIQSIYVIGFFFVKDLLMNFSGAPTGVAHLAHIGGTLYGILLSAALLFFNLLPRDHFDMLSIARHWNRRRQFRELTAGGYDPFGYSPRVPVENRLPQPVTEQQMRVQDLKGRINDALSHHDHIRAADSYLELKQVDAEQVLARQAQLEVANQLASQQRYNEAAEAYEMFLRHYKNFEQIEQVELMLGLIYARYLSRDDRAKEYLLRAMARLHGERELSLARTELKRIESTQAP